MKIGISLFYRWCLLILAVKNSSITLNILVRYADDVIIKSYKLSCV